MKMWNLKLGSRLVWLQHRLQLCRVYSQAQLIEQLPKAFSLESASTTSTVTQQIQRILKRFPSDIRPISKMDDIPFTPEVLTNHVLSYYKSICNDDSKKRLFYAYLVKHLGPDCADVHKAAKTLTDMYSKDYDSSKLLRAEVQLQNVLSPMYIEIFRWIVQKNGGLKALVDMRSDLLSIIRDSNEEGTLVHDLKELDVHFRSLLSQWFSHGFLDLQQITWQSPCDIIEKVSEYEAVHSIRSWKDIKHRVGPFRRVFILTHRNMPREPIIVLHSALTQSPSSSVQTLLNRQVHEIKSLNDVRSAVFYSISAAHKGLSGIELGNSLILQVVEALKKEIPSLQQFVTLSPVPGFRKWLEAHFHSCINDSSVFKISLEKLQELKILCPDQTNIHLFLQHVLDTNDWSATASTRMNALKQPLMSLCAKYLVNEKRRGFALNPVTNFHIRNGASLWRLNWLADISPKGLKDSYGIMANYKYDLSSMSEYKQHYVLQGNINFSDDVEKLLND